MPEYTSPGVYVEEVNPVPPSVAAVPTAIPAFIGYTSRAARGRRSLRLRPTRITSFAEFQTLFGVVSADRVNPAPDSAQLRPRFSLTPATAASSGDLMLGSTRWNLAADGSSLSYFYASLKLFYANGGGSCYIVSVGRLRKATTDAAPHTNPHLKLDDLLAGLAPLERETEPTMVVIPDATLLAAADYAALNQAALQHCQSLRSRVALLDVRGADAPDAGLWTNDVASFRAGIGEIGLSYGAAYYPFLRTTILETSAITAKNLGGARALRRVLSDASTAPVKALLTQMGRRPAPTHETLAQLDADLRAASPDYAQIHALMLARINTLPPSAALAGVITTVDRTQGVWKAPANVALQAASDLTLTLNDRMQELLNVDPVNGKSINVIRRFTGRGILVWGARTLDGNDQEWRYVNVRRTAIMIGQSIKNALQPFVFEPNSPVTWTRIQAMMENFLMTLWRSGALVGQKPEQAYHVRVGLGTTMTEQDIANGLLKVSVMLALLRPGEFHVLTFQQKQSA